MEQKDEIIKQAVALLRNKGHRINNQEIETIFKICERKIKMVGKQEKYFEILFPEELRNYIFRRTINDIACLVMEETHV